MKKILFLLLITTSVFAQLPSKFDKIKVVNATKNNDATRVVVQDSITKEYHWVLKSTVGTGTVTSVTGTDGITVANGTTTPVIGISTIAQNKVTDLVTDLSGKAPLASPALTGIPTAPTATAGTNTTQLATTAFVRGIDLDNVKISGTQTITGIKTFSSATTTFGNKIKHHYLDNPANAISWQILDLAPSQGAFSIGTNTVNMSMRESGPRFISVTDPIESPNGTASNHLVNKSQLSNKLDNSFFVNDYVSQNPPTELVSSLYESFPLLIRAQSNKMFVFYRQGDTHASSKGVIKNRTSNDGGATWTTSNTIISDPIYDCRNVSGGVTSNGRIILFYMRYIYGSSISFDQGYIYSDDEGGSWSNYAIIPNGTHTFFSPYGKIIAIGDGKLMANWYGETSSTPVYSSYVITSSDNGSTWSSAVTVATSASVKFGESSYAYLDGGIITGIIRNSVGAVLQQVKSIDNGVSWTVQGAISFDTGSQVSPELSTYVDSNNEKYVVLFYANRTDNKLKSITGSYSGLITGVSGWNLNSISTITTHTGTDFGYPSVVKAREGNKFLLTIYKATSTTLASIKFFNYTPLYNEISSVSNIKTSNLFRNNRGLGTHFLIDNENNINRWAWVLKNTETGSDIGADLNLERFNDAGTFISNALVINRSTGNSIWSGNISSVSTVSGKDLLASNFLEIKGLIGTFPTTGSGIEMFNQSGISTIQTYDRGGSVYNALNFRGLYQSWGTGATERMRLHASGGLSIGNTTDPGGANLSVTGKIISNNTVRLKNFTVATLPTGVQGDTAFVTDALAPSYLVTVVGGGTVVTVVFFNGTNWVSH